MPRETKTRWEGVWARHRAGCPARDGGRCRCTPSYIARVYDRAARRHVASPSFPTADAARSWRTDRLAAQDVGQTITPATRRVRDVAAEFLDAARSGRALNKRGQRFKASALRDIEGALRVWVLPELGAERIDRVRRRDVQQLVDLMVAEGLSGSRVRSAVNALRTLYAWAITREIVHASPITGVQLPAMDETPRDRVAAPDEAAALLAALAPDDRLPLALALYGGGRRSEIRFLTWCDVDRDRWAVTWGADERARKSRAAHRLVPAVTPLVALLREQWMRLGRPDDGLVCPGQKPGGRNSGMLSIEAWQTRADSAWQMAGLERITLHEARHTCATWLDRAGVRPVVQARWLGHAPQGGISQARYTHVLDDDLVEAAGLLAGMLSGRRRVEAV